VVGMMYYDGDRAFWWGWCTVMGLEMGTMHGNGDHAQWWGLHTLMSMKHSCSTADNAWERTYTRADAPLWGRALVSAGFVIYAGKHQGMLCTITLLRLHQANHQVSIPSTSSRLDRIDPTREEATTVYSPFVRATMDRISSTTFPKVAFSNPPTVGPKRTARSSVISPRMSASGISPTMFCRESMALSAVMILKIKIKFIIIIKTCA